MLTPIYRAAEPNRLRCAILWIGPLATALALLIPGMAVAQLPNERCVECHSRVLIDLLPIRFSDGEEVSPRVDVEVLSRSVHAELACIECHRSSHPEFTGTIGPRSFPTRREYVRDIERACRDCHESVFRTVDGRAVVHDTYQAGDGPLCVDCHSGHATRSVSSAFVAAGPMEGTKSWSGMFATKGVEYLLVIAYAALFIPLAILLCRVAQQVAAPRVEELPARRGGSWFRLPEGYFLHRGHTWAVPEAGPVFKVGMDDFAGRLIGEPAAVMLPSPGSRLDQGERGWQVRVNGTIFDLLSPLPGEVIEINEQAVKSPGAVVEDPYGQGWLMKVRAPQPQAALSNLLSDRLADTCYDEAEEQLGSLMEGRLGTVLQDGGTPVRGFARELGGDSWPELVTRFLLTESRPASPSQQGRQDTQS